MKGEDLHTKVELSLEDAYAGATLRNSLSVLSDGRARATGQGRSRRLRRLAWRVLARPTFDA